MKQGRAQQARAWLERAKAAGDPGARSMLARLGIDATAEGAVTETNIPEDRLMEVRELLDDLNAAANARDAAALTRHIAPEARIQVTLPGRSGAQIMTPATYRELWRATFAKPDRYNFSRVHFDVMEQGSQLRIVSEILETFTTGGESMNLRLDEILLVSLEAEQAVITAVDLDATAQR